MKLIKILRELTEDDCSTVERYDLDSTLKVITN